MVERILFILNEGTIRGALTPSEQSFLKSISQQAAKKALTVNQNNWFQTIEAKVKDACDGRWETDWNSEKAKNLKIAISYYKNAQLGCIYFRDIVEWVEQNPDKIISKINYKKIVENKYAKKIIRALSKKPKYNNDEAVCYRAGRGPFKFRSIPLFILKALDKAVNAVNGARIYLVLPSNSSQPLEIEERELKLWRKTKAKKDKNVLPF